MAGTDSKPSGRKTVRTVFAVLLLIAGVLLWYLLAQGIPVGMDIKKGNYTSVTVTDLKNGASASFTARSDEEAAQRGETYPHWKNASNILHLVRIVPFDSTGSFDPQIRFDFVMDTGENRSFLIGDDAVSYDGKTYRIHHWTDSRLFSDLIRSIYLKDESIVVEDLVEDDD